MRKSQEEKEREMYILKKECSKCKEKKDKSEFNRCEKSRDGLLSWCRECQAVKNRSYRKKDWLKEFLIG